MTTQTFRYEAIDAVGDLQKGTIEADSADAAAVTLNSRKLTPLSVSESGVGLQKEIKIPGFGGKVKSQDLAIMSRQMSTMIGAGLSLIRTLSILADQTENKELARLLGIIRSDVEQGQSLSEAFAKHEAFPPLMVHMIKAGELGGFLDKVLIQLAENFEADVKLRAKVKSAMTYPVVVFVIAITSVIGMLLFIVPIFAKMFDSLGATLPAPTRALVFLSTAMKWSALPALVIGIVLAIVWSRIKHKPEVREWVDPIKLRAPIFGDLFRKIAISRLTRNLGTMLAAGVPILQSLDIVAETSGNAVVGKAIRAVQDSVRQGEALARPLADHPVFPPMVVQMMAVGEDTGALDVMLLKISDFYDQEVEATTEALTALIEPLMIAFLGGIVGSMIVALYMPIFKVFDLIQ